MKKTILAFIVLILVQSSSNGFTFTDFVEVNTGLMDNPDLLGFQTWAMRVTSDGTDWTNADLDIRLTSGTLNHTTGLFGAAEPGPQNLGDTAVFAPLNALGDLTSGPFGGAALTVAGGPNGPFKETPTSFEASWGTTFTGDVNRTFDIAMVTFSNDAEGVIDFRTISGSQLEHGGINGVGISFIIRNGLVLFGCPEPTTLALIGIGVCSLLGVRRRK